MTAKADDAPAQGASQTAPLAAREPLPSPRVGAGKDAGSNNAPVPDDANSDTQLNEEVGGYKGPDPTRYGDWEHKGRCTDF